MEFGFPELTSGQICTSLDDLFGIKLNESWFTKPDPLQWQSIVRKCLCEITGAPEDAFFQQHLSAMVFEYPELHTDSVPVMHLIEALPSSDLTIFLDLTPKVMPSLDVHDFRGADVLSPTTVRVKKICSAIINFFRFKETLIPTYERVRSDIERDREHHEALLKRNEELKQRINNIRSERAQQEPQVQKVQDEVEQLQLRMQEKGRTKQAIHMAVSDIKTRIMEKKAKRDQLNCAILKSKEDEERLAAKIVQSPEKVRAEQDHLKEQLQNMMEDLDKKRNRLSQLKEQRQRAKQAGVDAEKGVQILTSVQASVDKENEIRAETAQLHDKIHECKEQGKELCTKKEQIQQQLSTKQEKLSKITLQYQSKSRVLHEQHDILVKEKSEFLAKQNSDTGRKQELYVYKKKAEQHVAEVQHTTEQTINSIKVMYGKLLENADTINKDFCSNWDEVRQLTKQA